MRCQRLRILRLVPWGTHEFRDTSTAWFASLLYLLGEHLALIDYLSVFYVQGIKADEVNGV